jgi:hypothetical protein
MKHKKWVNILMVVVVSLIFLIFWLVGFNHIYAQALKFGANLFLSPWKDIYFEMDPTSKTPTFIVHSIIGGRTGSYDQEGKLILLPIIMILTWQVLLFFNLSTDKALRSTVENVVIFYLLQVIYLLLLTQYYNSAVVKYIYDLLRDSFYILALFLILKDAIRFRLIKIPGK